MASSKPPKPLLDRWNLELVKVLDAPDVREQLSKHGLTPQPGTREDLARYIASESATWGRIIKDRKSTAELAYGLTSANAPFVILGIWLRWFMGAVYLFLLFSS